MGNCMGSRRGAARVVDDGGDWGFSSDEDEHEKTTTTKENEEEERSLLGEKGSTAAGATKEVIKIRITKKQLRELLRKAEGQGLQAQEVVAELVGLDEFYREHRKRHWKPALQSIPEIGE